MATTTSFWSQWKVVIIGGIASVITVLQQYLTGSPDPKVVIFAVLVALGSFLAKNLAGQAATIAGIVASLVATISTEYATGHISWLQIILQAVVSIGGIFAGSLTTHPVSGKLMLKKVNGK
jgi:hypothetical protein